LINFAENYNLFVKIELIIVGKTDVDWIKEGFEVYQKRLSHYINFNVTVIPDIRNRKNLAQEQQKEQEGILILKQLQASDFVILLDENGKQFDSIQFSDFLQKKMNSGIKRLVFVIGGPYGFSSHLHQKANQKISLSKMTFSHQMVRPFFVEQLYRAFSILNNEPYHHQ
jgi:23S rRNA (pseudouridine1915-N3)-methyltransferase